MWGPRRGFSSNVPSLAPLPVSPPSLNQMLPREPAVCPLQLSLPCLRIIFLPPDQRFLNFLDHPSPQYSVFPSGEPGVSGDFWVRAVHLSHHCFHMRTWFSVLLLAQD